MKNSFIGTLTISLSLGILGGCNIPETLNILSNNSATANVSGQVNVDSGAADKIADASQSAQASSSSGLSKEQEAKLDKLIDIASQSQQATPIVIVATTTIIVEPATASERVDTSFDEVVGEFSGRIPLRLSDGLIGSASVEVNDAVWSYVKGRITAVFTGDVNGVYSHDEAGKVWEKELFDVPLGNFEKRHAALFQVVNATESVGPISHIDWSQRAFIMTDGSTASIPESLGEGNYPPDYLNRYAIVGTEVSVWGWSNPPSVSRKKKKWMPLERGIIKGEPIYWIYDPLHKRVLVVSQTDNNRYHFYRLTEEKI